MHQLPLDALLLEDLREVDRVVHERMRTRSTAILAMGEHIVGSTDTRTLAAIALLAARLGDYRLERVLHVASTVELIHAALQVHDELVDQAARRSDSSALHAPWDKGFSLMVGDYLFALASLEMAEVPDPRVMTYFAQAVMRISEGMLTPVMVAEPVALAEEQYLDYIGAVTAALFEAACKSGLAVVGGSPEQIDAIGRFGYDLGLCFHIGEDVRAYADNDSTDNRSGDTLRRGRITLPLIYAVATSGDKRLLHVADGNDGDAEQNAWTRDQVRAYGVPQSLATVRRLRDKALTHLAAFPEAPARRTLAAIADAIMTD